MYETLYLPSVSLQKETPANMTLRQEGNLLKFLHLTIDMSSFPHRNISRN